MATERTGTPKAFLGRIRTILHGNRPKLSHPKTGTPKAFLGRIRRILHGHRANGNAKGVPWENPHDSPWEPTETLPPQNGNVAGLRSLREIFDFSGQRERLRRSLAVHSVNCGQGERRRTPFLGRIRRTLVHSAGRSVFCLDGGPSSVSLYKVDSVAFASGGAPQYGNGLRIASEQPRLEVELQLIDMERPTRPIRITHSEFFSQD